MLKVADRWFEHRRVDDRLFLFWEPHVHPLLRCNVWLARGRDADLLVDTGLGVSSLKAALAPVLDKPVVAVATHIHYDHVGSLHEFDNKVMHEDEADRMADYREFQPLAMSDFPPDFLSAFADPAFDEWLVNAVPSAGYEPANYAVVSTTPTRRVVDGDVIDLGDRSFEVLHLPGHSPGSMGLYEAQSRTLFSGDAIYDGELLDELPDSSIPDYVATMRRLRQLDVQVVHGGHEASFGQHRLHELVDAYLAMRT